MTLSPLPADVILLICEELGNSQSFGTLLNCALASKHLARPALLFMYQNHHQSSFFSGDDDTKLSLAPRLSMEVRESLAKETSRKWALLWKSIIRSSLDNSPTAYPYCLYICSLDLANLDLLLDDFYFQIGVQDSFFNDDMAQFLEVQDTPKEIKTRAGKIQPRRLEVKKIINLVGESITRFISDSAERSHATAALEEILGPLNQVSLPIWTSRLSRLRSMNLYDANVLNENLAIAINNNCPHFDDLTFFRFGLNDPESGMASFFSTLRANTIKSFNALNAQRVGAETLLSLNNHSYSLKTLKLDGLVTDAVRNLSLLQGCVNLEVLEITGDGSGLDLEETENEVFLEIVDWLGRCTQLRELRFRKFMSALAILNQLCLRENLHLRQLEVRNYYFPAAREFHQVLSNQKSLDSLVLRAEDADESTRDDIEILLYSISQLTNLKELDLSETSEMFNSSHIKQIAASLPKLEELFIGGYDARDTIWPSFAGLKYLRALNIHALSSFTCNGILNYISQLQPTNQGLGLWVSSQREEYDLTDEEKTKIRESIYKKAGGRFDFLLYREHDSDLELYSD
ncbi:hypothetical protein B0O99DRAFT_736883 [Bisporella sp. PMI_857]|nr:hypothetical protein B0O99DRAFT_736883 [Bisporella sp. PMI_857]